MSAYLIRRCMETRSERKRPAFLLEGGQVVSVLEDQDKQTAPSVELYHVTLVIGDMQAEGD